MCVCFVVVVVVIVVKIYSIDGSNFENLCLCVCFIFVYGLICGFDLRKGLHIYMRRVFELRIGRQSLTVLSTVGRTLKCSH